MANKQDKQAPVQPQVPHEPDKAPLSNAEDNADNTSERTEQEEDIISPTADTDLAEDGIRNDAVLAGENNFSDPDLSGQDKASTKKNADVQKKRPETSDADSKNEGK